MNFAVSDKNPKVWIEQICRKDRRALEKLYDHYSSLAYTFAMRILNSKQDAEEVLQDVFLQIWNDASRYDASKGAPEAWIITISRSRALDKLRSAKRKKELTQSLDGLNEQGFEPQNPNTNALSWSDPIAAQSLLEKLPAAQKSVMVLAYLKGMTQSEIAEQLKLPLGTVKTHMRSALNSLREWTASFKENELAYGS